MSLWTCFGAFIAASSSSGTTVVAPSATSRRIDFSFGRFTTQCLLQRAASEDRAFYGFVDQLRLTVSIAKADAVQESPRVVGPQAGDVAHLARYSTQHK